MIIIDYIQPVGGNEAYQVEKERMEQTIRVLKKLAVHENIPVFAISQLHRFVRSDPHPVLEDLVSTLGKENLEKIDVGLLFYLDEQERRKCNSGEQKLKIEITTARNSYGGSELLKYDLSVYFDD